MRARERAKHEGFEQVIDEGLRARGIDADSAQLLARVGVACYDLAVAGWLQDADPRDPGLPARIRRGFALARDLLAAD